MAELLNSKWRDLIFIGLGAVLAWIIFLFISAGSIEEQGAIASLFLGLFAVTIVPGIAALNDRWILFPYARPLSADRVLDREFMWRRLAVIGLSCLTFALVV